MLRKFSVILCVLTVACAPAPAAPVTAEVCNNLWSHYTTALDTAVRYRQAGDIARAQYYLTGAQMNLEVLLARDCSQHGISPGWIQF